jgi:hypothetical protein
LEPALSEPLSAQLSSALPLELALSELLTAHLLSALPLELALSEPLTAHLLLALPLELALSEPSCRRPIHSMAHCPTHLGNNPAVSSNCELSSGTSHNDKKRHQCSAAGMMPLSVLLTGCGLDRCF